MDADSSSAFQVAYLADLLGLDGAIDEARALLQGAQRRFPQLDDVARTDFRIAALVGDAGRAQAWLEGRQGRFALRASTEPMWRAVVAARVAPSPGTTGTAVRAVLSAAEREPEIGLRTLKRLVALRRPDAALALAAAPPVMDVDDEDQDILFSRLMQPLRADPRFMDIAARQGLVALWMRSDRWPDFCGEKDLGYDCRAEAKRALAQVARARRKALSPRRAT